jgi:hypothetical protein
MKANEWQCNIPELVSEASFPVYGFVNNPYGLKPCSISWGDSNGRLMHIGFVFSSPQYPEKREAFVIDSLDAHEPGVVYDAKDDSGASFFDLDARLFESYRLGDDVRKQAGKPQIVQDTLVIAGKAFTGEIFYWSHLYRLSRFFFANEETRLTGMTCGLSLQEVLELLQGAEIVNQNEHALSQYQQQLEQETERLPS